jgi:tRNA uridine 5-carboxymethylaminomethyl modification enzyme
VLTTGTFLDALMHFGLTQEAGGRIGEGAATRLSRSFAMLGLEIGRLKTGTPARIARESIGFSRTELQPGDEPPPPFSFRTARLELEQVPCYLTRTNERTHDVIRGNLDRSPMYTGVIRSIGPRYCPSIEDKVVRFADKASHQVFLEPETREGDSIYPNGVSTSLPPDVQEAFLRTIPGLEQCRILRPGYAVEYTFVLPSQLHPTLEVKDVPGLFLAGQINGTSGYEEAAGQGLLAGINAALKTKEEPPLVLRRDEAYIGVLVDDLITKVPREPYRMFTSRAEYRLLLRQDNADLRLADHARRVGMSSEREYGAFCRYREAVNREVQRLETTPLRRTALDADELERLGIGLPDKNVTLAQFLGRPGVTLETLTRLGLAEVPVMELEDRVKGVDRTHSPTEGAAGVESLDRKQRGAATGAVDGKRSREGDLFQQAEREYLEAMRVRGPERAAFQIQTAVQYAGYIKRQAEQIEQGRKMEETRLPADLNYEGVRGLRKESASLLAAHRPATLGQAARIAGVTPADIAVLQVYLRARRAGKVSQEKQPDRRGDSAAARMESAP